ncbi:apoptosis-enhancing nuclease [Chanos chanos]|uniref:Apoptosis-enhancing nuclease n=1 Tax=Chanos chanos TaxID=29144 RepID=A0A6J2USP0_CHACN|nr:apoptosis-enhancing nuclease-like [Chanos chanos]
MSPDRLVAMDCEMVGTGPGGQCNELARCSLVGYSGIVLYDKYILPRHPVTDYHTGWRGITEHHLIRALPFEEARKEILQILKGKVVIGHALHNDFRALEFIPPRHLIRDTSRMHCLRDMCGVPVKACVPLKTLAQKLLSREIQGDRLGHCSVEDARIALELYKLVEEQWEADMASTVSDSDLLLSPSFTPEHYMQGWLDHMMDCSQ